MKAFTAVFGFALDAEGSVAQFCELALFEDRFTFLTSAGPEVYAATSLV
jgi:hypothetical protein